MIARSETPGPSSPDSRIAAAALAAVALFAAAWAVLHVGFYTHRQIIDTPIYQRYGNAIAHGAVPYRDFSVEYPPGALPMFALPGFAEPGRDQDVSDGFRRAFELLMWTCGAAALLAMASTLRAVGAPPARLWGALTFAALAPLALGSVVLSRFDLWPAAIVAAALAALVWGRLRLGSALLGLGVAAKLYPALLVPIAVAYAWKRSGRREALVCLGLAAGVVSAIFLPFVVVSPGGIWDSLWQQLSRPLQVESLGAAVLLGAHHLFGLGLTQESSHGSQNLVGTAPGVVAGLFTAVQAGVLLWIWTSFARGRGDREALLQGSAAALCAFVAFGKVLSPQFLIWLVPVVPLVRPVRPAVLLGAALVLTQLWFPFRYWELALRFDATPSWFLQVRDLLLVVLVVLLAYGLGVRQRVSPPRGPP